MAASLLAFGVASALYRRERTGRGGRVDTSLLLAALALQNNLMVRVDGLDGARHTAFADWLGQARRGGVPFPEQVERMPRNRVISSRAIYVRTYATKDAALAVACGSPSLRRKFIAAVGHKDPALTAKVPDEAAHYAALRSAVEATLASRTTAEWQALLDAAGIPASGVALPLEILDDPQPAANGMFHRFDHAALGPVTVLGPPLRVGDGGFTAGAADAAVRQRGPRDPRAGRLRRGRCAAAARGRRGHAEQVSLADRSGIPRSRRISCCLARCRKVYLIVDLDGAWSVRGLHIGGAPRRCFQTHVEAAQLPARLHVRENQGYRLDRPLLRLAGRLKTPGLESSQHRETPHADALTRAAGRRDRRAVRAPRRRHRAPARPHPRVRRSRAAGTTASARAPPGWPGASASTWARRASGSAWRARSGDAAAAGRGAGPRRALLRQGPGPDPRGHAGDRGATARGRARGHRRARRAHRAGLAPRGPARPRRARRRDSTRAGRCTCIQDEDGTVVVRGRLAPEAGARAHAGADRRPRDAVPAGRAGDAQRGRRFRGNAARSAQQQADALALLAETALHHGIDPGAPGERYQVVVHVDAEVLADAEAPGQSVLEERRARFRGNVPAPGVRRQPGGDAPRRRRRASWRSGPGPGRFRRPCAARSHHRDQGCRFPGCDLRFGQGHHIQHWAQGGPTTLSNLALLCRRHHRAVHEEGFQVERRDDGALEFRWPYGDVLRPVPPPPRIPDDAAAEVRARNTAAGISVHPHTATPGWDGEAWTSAGRSMCCIRWPTRCRNWRASSSLPQPRDPATSPTGAGPEVRREHAAALDRQVRADHRAVRRAGPTPRTS